MKRMRIDRSHYGGALREPGGSVEVYRDAAGKWRSRRVADNGKELFDSGEGYERKIDCIQEAMQCFPNVTEFYELT